MSNVEDITNIAVVGFTVGVAAKSLELLNKPIKKSKGKFKNSILEF